MSREEFLSISPREFDAMAQRLERRRDDTRFASAMVCAAIYNVNCDYSLRPEGFSPSDFIPVKRKPDNDIELFAKECEANGYTHIPTERDKQLAASFTAQLKKTFKNVEPGKVYQVKK